MIDEGLRWVQPQIEPGHHELRDSREQLVATLEFQPRPAVSWGYTDRRQARGEAGTAGWDFWIERPGLGGFLGISANVSITGTDTGTLKAGTNFIRGTLQLASGRSFQWDGGATRRGSSTFSDEGGRLLIRFREGSMMERVNTHIDLQPETADLPEKMLLISLGLYLRIAMTKVFRR